MFARNRSGIALAGLITWLIAVAAGCGQSPPEPVDTSALEEQLRADALAWFGYYANADADGMANLYTEDALLMPPSAAAVKGRPGIKAFLGEDAAKTKAAGASLKNGSVTGVGVSGDVGWVSGTYTVLDASGAAIDSGNYLSVHHLVGGKWLYIRDIWNSDQPPAPAPATEPGPQ